MNKKPGDIVKVIGQNNIGKKYCPENIGRVGVVMKTEGAISPYSVTIRYTDGSKGHDTYLHEHLQKTGHRDTFEEATITEGAGSIHYLWPLPAVGTESWED